MLCFVASKCWAKLFLDLEQAANSSFKTMLCTRDWSLSSLRSLSSLLLPHKAPRNLSRPYSSLRALLVSGSRVLAVAIFISLSSAFSFQILRAVDLNLSLTVWACSSSALRACTSSSSSGASTSFHLAVLKLGSQSKPCTWTFNHLR
ncbi:hypothetical protein GmHk_18G051440 [Glycine max]|nr:hypothetical protein GmHk_18G051440 [Glycine max]